MNSFLISSLFLGSAQAEDLSSADTSYIGATILEGDVDMTFNPADVYTIDPSDSDLVASAEFVGNSLYIQAEDEDGNSVNAIIEFFWFESSIDRGSDFYVAVVKARAIPNLNEGGSLWTDSWTSAHPVLSVYADRPASGSPGAFRWDWAVPFENYGVDAYGQISLNNSYGIGANAEGSAMGAVAVPEETEINGVGV